MLWVGIFQVKQGIKVQFMKFIVGPGAAMKFNKTITIYIHTHTHTHTHFYIIDVDSLGLIRFDQLTVKTIGLSPT